MPVPLFRSPLETFNTLVPKDPGGRQVASDQAYGDHPRQRLDLYAPRRRPSGLLPILVFFYGGSWASGLRQGYTFAGRALASRGFLIAVPDYRLVPEVQFPAFIEDGAAAVRWVRAHAADHGGGPDRIVLAGHSAGAYIAAMLALDGSRLGEDRRAVSGLAGIAGPYDFLPLNGPVTRAAFGNAPNPSLTQPIRFASEATCPLLLLHGAKDRTVGPRNSRALAEAVNAAGGDARLVMYPELAHVDIVTALALPFRRRAPVLADLAAFAHQVTGT